jgi:hypothetical protein
MNSSITISKKEYEDLRYDSETLNLFYKENQVIKEEFYSLHKRVFNVEQYKKEIQKILNNTSLTCTNKINMIEEVEV